MSTEHDYDEHDIKEMMEMGEQRVDDLREELEAVTAQRDILLAACCAAIDTFPNLAERQLRAAIANASHASSTT